MTELPEEWRITEKQLEMITDKVKTLGRKEASLVIKIVLAILDSRTPPELRK